MKTFVVLLCVLATALAKPADTYNPEYDNFNAQEVAENERFLKNYGNCFLEKGPCTPEGLDIRNILPEAVKTKCAKCSPKQLENVRIVVNGFKEKVPEILEEIMQKVDPKGEYRTAFEELMSKTS